MEWRKEDLVVSYRGRSRLPLVRRMTKSVFLKKVDIFHDL